MIKKFCSIALFSIVFISSVYSQPSEYEHHGCHQVRNRVAGIRWTPEQIAQGRAALERSDTFDILHYDINLDVTAFAARRLKGVCTVTFRTLIEELNYINLDLEALVVDSVYSDDIKLDFVHEGTLLKISTSSVLAMGDTSAVTIFYGGIPITSASGFGGFYFENGYAYNLGIGLNDNPHNFGRAWFPCFDNFVERATYDFDLTTSNGNVAYCVGTLISRDSIGDGLLSNKYVMDQPIPTYLTSVAVSNYVQRDVVHESLYGPVDIQIVARPGDINSAATSLQNLGKAVEAFEKWYGPYHWERVGYVITPRGAMEHPTNTAYPVGSVSGGTQDNRLMAHELCHHWWGNMLTLKTSHDMWIKEGNAEYGAHLYTEFAEGEDAFKAQVKTNGMRVVRRLHLDDDAGFLPLSPMPEDKTYNTHTYYKGAYVIHNMRAYLGDSLFALSQSSILENNLYGNLTAYTYRDQISQITGVDMTDFFKDWVFEGGYPA
ncbi:MAG: M1 family metallopeptidase [Saprospiraceae bacterium]|nr:M1 family metallopeptidase [Saprospiraceae bacterium]